MGSEKEGEGKGVSNMETKKGLEKQSLSTRQIRSVRVPEFAHEGVLSERTVCLFKCIISSRTGHEQSRGKSGSGSLDSEATRMDWLVRAELISVTELSQSVT